MNRKTVEVFHALMKNGWIDRHEDHIIWSYADDGNSRGIRRIQIGYGN